jgi:hypothetical protein
VDMDVFVANIYNLAKRKVILRPIFPDCVKWSHDGSLTNQMSRLLIMFRNIAYKHPFSNPWKFGNQSL